MKKLLVIQLLFTLTAQSSDVKINKYVPKNTFLGYEKSDNYKLDETSISQVKKEITNKYDLKERHLCRAMLNNCNNILNIKNNNKNYVLNETDIECLFTFFIKLNYEIKTYSDRLEYECYFTTKEIKSAFLKKNISRYKTVNINGIKKVSFTRLKLFFKILQEDFTNKELEEIISNINSPKDKKSLLYLAYESYENWNKEEHKRIFKFLLMHGADFKENEETIELINNLELSLINYLTNKKLIK